MWELDQFEIVLGVVAGAVLLAGIVLAAHAWVRMEACSEQEDYYKALRCREMKRQERKMKRRTIGFLISDHSMALATQIAALVGVHPATQEEAFGQLCETCKEALAAYEHKAGRMSHRLNPLEYEVSQSVTHES
jgi:hypothetical protein